MITDKRSGTMIFVLGLKFNYMLINEIEMLQVSNTRH